MAEGLRGKRIVAVATDFTIDQVRPASYAGLVHSRLLADFCAVPVTPGAVVALREKVDAAICDRRQLSLFREPIATGFCWRCRLQLSGAENAWNNSADHSDPHSDRCFADLAVQPRLGILPDRRIWDFADHHHHSSADRPDLRGGVKPRQLPLSGQLIHELPGDWADRSTRSSGDRVVVDQNSGRVVLEHCENGFLDIRIGPAHP
jgi:hypothetical protein